MKTSNIRLLATMITLAAVTTTATIPANAQRRSSNDERGRKEVRNETKKPDQKFNKNNSYQNKDWSSNSKDFNRSNNDRRDVNRNHSYNNDRKWNDNHNKNKTWNNNHWGRKDWDRNKYNNNHKYSYKNHKYYYHHPVYGDVIRKFNRSPIRFFSNNAPFYFFDGHFYKYHRGIGYIHIGVPYNTIFTSLPYGYERVMIDGFVYFRIGNLFFEAHPYGYRLINVPERFYSYRF